jgi:hypothetical protein
MGRSAATSDGFVQRRDRHTSRFIVAGALPLAVLTLAACAASSSSSSASACAASARVYAGVVVGSFDTTVAAIRRLDGQVEPPRWPGMPADRPAVLCYIDAQIPKGPPPGPNGEVREPFDRVLVGILDGESEMIAAGYRDRLPVEAP